MRLWPSIIPRGSPDIGWSDLCWSLVDCFRLDGSDAELKVESLWSSAGDACACLSVRSGFDLLLSAVSWPAGSEVLVSAITIPGMLKVLHAHGLVAVPLDIDPQTLSISAEQVRQRTGPRTKAVLVAHLFGSRSQLGEVISLARQKNLLVIEDCAQAYDASRWRGHADADVSMFSFGPIKTQTALGGALLCVRSPMLLETMRRKRDSYPRRSRGSFLRRVLLFAALKAIARPRVLGVSVRVCQLFGLDYDAAASNFTRGFHGDKLLVQLRHRAPRAMLRLLARRLRAPSRQWIKHRMHLAQTVAAQLDRLPPGHAAANHSHWVLPIVTANPDGLVQWLVAGGFDATRRGSSLIAVPPPADRLDWEPREARRLIEHLVFLPLPASLTDQEAARLGSLVKKFDRDAAQPSAAEPVHSKLSS